MPDAFDVAEREKPPIVDAFEGSYDFVSDFVYSIKPESLPFAAAISAPQLHGLMQIMH
jgi:hypothetical protein